MAKPNTARLDKFRKDRKAAVDQIKKVVEPVMFHHKTSDGRDWARVRVYELPGMIRDGEIARRIGELEQLLGAREDELGLPRSQETDGPVSSRLYRIVKARPPGNV